MMVDKYMCRLNYFTQQQYYAYILDHEYLHKVKCEGAGLQSVGAGPSSGLFLGAFFTGKNNYKD